MPLGKPSIKGVDKTKILFSTRRLLLSGPFVVETPFYNLIISTEQEKSVRSRTDLEYECFEGAGCVERGMSGFLKSKPRQFSTRKLLFRCAFDAPQLLKSTPNRR